MTDIICVLMYMPFILINGILLGTNIQKKEKLFVDKLYIFLCLLLLGWHCMEILFLMVPSSGGKEFFYSAKFVFIASIAPTFFYLAAGFYRIVDKLPSYIPKCMTLFSAAIALLALTNSWHGLFRGDFMLISADPLTLVRSSTGIGYTAHMVASQLSFIGVLVVVLMQYKKLPKEYRASSLLLIAGCIVYMIGFALEIGGLDGNNPLDANLFGISLASLFFYIAVNSYGRADYLSAWQRNAFDYMDDAIVLLNQSGIVVDANQAAQKLFATIGKNGGTDHFDTMLENAQKRGQLTMRDIMGEGGERARQDIYIANGKYARVYSLQRRALPAKNNATGGEFVTISEVTWNRLLIERLRATAGVDALTGLHNRFGYEETLRAWDTEDSLPLSVIMSDVNNLKMVNDVQGHDVGDAILRLLGELLVCECPEEAYIARIGGDEFVILLRNFSDEDARALIMRLQQAVAEVASAEKPLSAAFGCATKRSMGQNINQLIRRADERMYTEKRRGEA